LGLTALYVDRDAPTIKIEVSRRTLAGLGYPMAVTLSVLALGDAPNARRLRSISTQVPADQDKTTVTLNSELRL
jgi:hypothetical protein